jgi:DNA-binding ferritin-like protein
MSDFVKYFFQLQNNIKLYHWNTTSFARHKASDELYEKIIELSDEFMEIYMGKYGRPNKGKANSITLKVWTDKDISEYIRTCLKDLEVLSLQLSQKDTDLLNIRDELMGKLNQTLYLYSLE